MATPSLLVTLALQVAVSLTFGLSFFGLWRGFQRPLAARWALAWLAYAIGVSLAALGVALGTRGIVSPVGGAALALPLQFAIILVRAGTDSVVAPPPSRRRYLVAAGVVLAVFVLFHGSVALGLVHLPTTFTPYTLPRLVLGAELAWAAWPLLRVAVPRWTEGVGLMAAALVGLSVRMFVIVAYDVQSLAQGAPTPPENLWLSLSLVCFLMVFGVSTAFVLVEGERLAAVRAAETIREKSAALEASEARAVEFFTAAPSGLVILDTQGRIGQANARFAALFGYAPDELQGRPIEGLLPSVFKDQPRPALRVNDASGSRTLPAGRDVVGVRRDGSEFPLEVAFSPIALRDAVLIASAVDLTERKRAEAALEALEAQFRHAQKMEAIGRLSGGMAHDFNNILTVIQGHASLLQLGETSAADVRDAAVAIEHASEHAASLTRQLLAFSRQQTMHSRDVDLNDEVTRVAGMLARTLGEDIHIEVTLAPESALVRVDPGMIDQVLLNLAVNARDAMPAGGRLVLDVSQQQVETPGGTGAPEAAAGAFVCVSVRDTGTGIPPEALPRIFEPFFTTKDVGKGTGLGLATVYGIAQQHGGWVTVESAVGKGTTFRLFLPTLTAVDPVAPAAAPPAIPTARGETILVVEDELTLRQLMRRILLGLGYHVLEAQDGAHALAAWKEAAGAVDLVLTDLVMPGGMSGLDLSRRLLQAQPGLKFVYTSGYSPEIAGSDVSRRDGVTFLAKPFRPVELARAVRASLDGRRDA